MEVETSSDRVDTVGEQQLPKHFVLSDSEPGARDTGSEARSRVECRPNVALVVLVRLATAVMLRVLVWALWTPL